MGDLEVHVVRAELVLREDADSRAPGGAVTLALCGAVDHTPPCHWPHHSAIQNAIAIEEDSALFRTVFVAPAEDVTEVRTRIDTALRSDARWRTLRVAAADLDADERALGDHLRTSLEA